MATAKKFQVNTLSGGTLTTGLVSYWSMEGNSNDFYGSNNGTDTSVTYGTSYGKVNQGAHYNSTPNSSISFGTTGMPYGVNAPMSMSEWVYLTVAPSVGATQYFFWYGDISYHPVTAGRFNVQYNNNGGTNQLIFGTDSNYDLAVNQTLSLNTWHHIVLTYDGTTGKMYLDNSMIVSGVIIYSTGVPGYHEIGSSVVNSYYLNNGNIDEVGVWSKALSTQEITDLYNGGAGQTMIWGDTQSDSMMNAASRFATVAGNILTIIKNVAVTMMNAASRTTTLVGTITKYVKALSVSMMNSVSRFVTIFAQPSIYFRTLSVSMMNSVSRLAVLTTGNMKILVVNMMNAAGRFTTLFSQQMLFIRNLTVNMMYAVNRLTSFIVSIPGQWNFRMKNIASWAFRSKHNTSWTFRNKDSLGPENIPSQPN